MSKPIAVNLSLCVVYGLYRHRKLLYIGSTAHYAKRLKKHMENPARTWTRMVAFIAVAERALSLQIERAMQAACQPPLNIWGTERSNTHSRTARLRDIQRKAVAVTGRHGIN